MKRLLNIGLVFALLLIPFAAYPQSDQRSAGSPPISQALVPEGDFAIKLATALKLGTPNDEAQAEDMLTSAGIAPSNGWIADYPVTPNVIGELQKAVSEAADGKKLPMGKEEALKAFRTATVEVGLPVVAETGGNYQETPPQYADSAAEDDYYSSEGPPAVTYYAPPPDYAYLYTWVPCPFFFDVAFFPGFFILNDFDIIVVGHHHFHHRITNHFFDSRTRLVSRVDPVTHARTPISRAAFNSSATRRAGSSILDRSTERGTVGRGTQNRQNFIANNRSGSAGGMTSSNSRSFTTGRSSQGFSGFSSGRSFGGFSGGHSSGGFSGGHSFGGFSGGHGGGGGRR